ncbi:MAG: hypothetical protein ACKOE2_11240, partial [Actinomycetales bacterium]
SSAEKPALINDASSLCALTDPAATSRSTDQGPSAYAEQMILDNPATPIQTHATDAVMAVRTFLAQFLG